ncbi:aminoglycoside phosphotransferase family protein [Kribbella sp. NBC_01505]|uniref:phosphotransferase family protein n=1 Tax=Kribbella sp. NBC_01505 TaxID=2903580 RepID=UPI00386F6A0C
MQTAEASEYAAAVLGPIESVEPVQGFVGNQTFRLRAVDGTVAYLKTGATIAAESHAIEQAATVGVAVPEILTTSLGTPPYLILAEVAGTPSDDPDVLVQAVQALRRLHGLHNAEADWAGTLTPLIDELEKLESVIPDELADRLRATMPPFIAEVADVRPALLHGDVHTRHLYAVDGKLTAILDWGDACYGDPLYDLARLTITADPSIVLGAYGLTPTESLQRTLSRYRILWSLAALHAEHAAGGDWFDPHVRRIAAELLS